MMRFFTRRKNICLIQVKEGKTVLVPVQLGLREKKLVEITSGLKQDDLLIITGQARLYPGI